MMMTRLNAIEISAIRNQSASGYQESESELLNLIYKDTTIEPSVKLQEISVTQDIIGKTYYFL